MIVVAICQEMKWDYYQYMKQPEWFVKLIEAKMRIDVEQLKERKY